VAFYASGNERLGDSIIDLNRGNTILQGRSSGAPIGVFSEYRADNGVAYISPNFAGFTFAGAFIPGEDKKSDAGIKEGDGAADHYSIGLMFNSNAFKASAGYQSTEVAGVEQEVMQVGGSVDFSGFSVGAQYEDTDNYGQVKGDDYKAWAVTGKFTFGNNAVSAVYTDSNLDFGGPGEADTSGWGLAGEHNFSKRTKVYAAYAANTLEVSGAGNLQVPLEVSPPVPP
jgi:predicted porin